MQPFDRKTTAAIDVDAQNTFTPLCPLELPVTGGNDIVAELNVQARLTAFRVGTKDAHSPASLWVDTDKEPQFTPIAEALNMDVRWKIHGVPGTPGFRLIEGLPRVVDYDYFVWKGIEPDMHPYGACYHDLANKMSTGLIEWLKVRGVQTVLLGGLALDYCVRLTALQLKEAGFRVIINLAATRGIWATTTLEKQVEEFNSLGIETVKNSAVLKTLVEG